MDRPTAEELYRRHHLKIFRFLRKMTGESAQAEDLTQDVFVRVIRGLETYDPRERDLAWLFRIARRLFADRERGGQRRPVLVQETLVGARPVPPTQSLGASLEEALGLVPQPEREAFLLREQGGLGYTEIVAISGVTPDAVRNRIYRARWQLRQILGPASHADAGSVPRRHPDES